MAKNVADTGSTAMRERAGDKSVAGKSDADKQEMQKKVEAAGTPGSAHKALDVLVGEWKAEVKCWMDPDGPPSVSQGTAKAAWILNGRFLEEEFHGEMMGKPFTGRGLMGYDNVTQMYHYVWMSDVQTSMFTTAGKGDKGGKVITLEGKSSCPATGRTDIPMKMVFRMTSASKHVFEMYDESKGESVKSMEIAYTKK